jgi:hypothetical protein
VPFSYPRRRSIPGARELRLPPFGTVHPVIPIPSPACTASIQRYVTDWNHYVTFCNHQCLFRRGFHSFEEVCVQQLGRPATR